MIELLEAMNSRLERIEMKLSVDSSTDPYIYMLGLIETGRLFSGKNLHLKNNLKSIKFVKTKKSRKTKVDHDASRPVILEGNTNWGTSLIGSYAKDASDATAACCELLRIHHPYATEIWDPEYVLKIGSPEGAKEEAKENIENVLDKMGLVTF